MQLRSLLVPLLAVLPVACRSSGNQAENNGEAQAAEAQAQPSGEQAAAAPGAAGENAAAPGAPKAAQAPPVPVNPQQQLQEDSAKAQVRQQQGAFLASEYIKKGDALLERADLAG